MFANVQALESFNDGEAEDWSNIEFQDKRTIKRLWAKFPYPDNIPIMKRVILSYENEWNQNEQNYYAFAADQMLIFVNRNDTLLKSVLSDVDKWITASQKVVNKARRIQNIIPADERATFNERIIELEGIIQEVDTVVQEGRDASEFYEEIARELSVDVQKSS